MDKFNPEKIRKYAATRAIEAIDSLQESLRQLQSQFVVIRDGIRDRDGTEQDLDYLDYEEMADALDYQHDDVVCLARELATQITVILVASGLRIG